MARAIEREPVSQSQGRRTGIIQAAARCAAYRTKLAESSDLAPIGISKSVLK